VNTRTSVQNFTLTCGIVYSVVGLLGLPRLLQPPPADPPSLLVSAGYGMLLGMFPVNALHNLLHLVTGLGGIASARYLGRARLYSRSVALLFGVLTVAGLTPGLDTLFGLIPAFGADVIPNALTTAVSSRFAWFASDAQPRANVGQPAQHSAGGHWRFDVSTELKVKSIWLWKVTGRRGSRSRHQGRD
jgi:hypothetical protein